MLKTAPLFGIGPVGFAGTISAPEKALRQVMQQKDGNLVLTTLLDEATVDGQRYALVGLKAVDNFEFKSLLKSYTGNTNQVRTARGCIVSNQPACEVGKAIAAGQYELMAEPVVAPH